MIGFRNRDISYNDKVGFATLRTIKRKDDLKVDEIYHQPKYQNYENMNDLVLREQSKY